MSNCILKQHWLTPMSQQASGTGKKKCFRLIFFDGNLLKHFFQLSPGIGPRLPTEAASVAPVGGHFLFCFTPSYCSFLVLTTMWTTPLPCLCSQWNTSRSTHPLGPLRHLSVVTVNPWQRCPCTQMGCFTDHISRQNTEMVMTLNICLILWFIYEKIVIIFLIIASFNFNKMKGNMLIVSTES